MYMLKIFIPYNMCVQIDNHNNNHNMYQHFTYMILYYEFF